jgi:hypothetical protein
MYQGYIVLRTVSHSIYDADLRGKEKILSMETYAVASVVGDQPRSIRARRRSRALTWAPRQPPSFRNADQLPGLFRA